MADTPAPVSRRKFLATVAVAAAATPALGALIDGAGEADAAARGKHAPGAKPAAPPPKPAEPAPAAGPHPDWSVAKTPAEREALEKQWKAMADLVTALRKTAVPVGAEFATGALAPTRLRREGN